MTIYQFCTDCLVKGDACVCKENPYDTDCMGHDKFMEMETRKINSIYFRERYIDDFSRRR